MRSLYRCTAPLLLLILAVPVRGQRDGPCEHEAMRTATLRAAGGARLELEAGAGSLQVTGRDGLAEVRVRGRACAATEALLRELLIETSAGNGEVSVRTRHPEQSQRNWNDNYAYIDLVLEVPAGMSARIDDGSGSVVLEGLGETEIEDGSGDLRITDGRGAVRIDDGSGSIDIEQVTGDVSIDDGSGDIDVRGVRGRVTLEDGSGEITVGDVTGTVHVRDDGSGSIRVRDVGGDLIVEDDGSGGVRHSGVRGRVQVPDED